MLDFIGLIKIDSLLIFISSKVIQQPKTTPAIIAALLLSIQIHLNFIYQNINIYLLGV